MTKVCESCRNLYKSYFSAPSSAFLHANIRVRTKATVTGVIEDAPLVASSIENKDRRSFDVETLGVERSERLCVSRESGKER